MVHAWSVLRGRIRIKSSVLVWKGFLDLPGIRLNTDREFKVFLGNGVPVLKKGLDMDKLVDGKTRECVYIPCRPSLQPVNCTR